MTALSLVLLGGLLGVRHAMDPDHVVAVGTIATRTPSLRRSAAVGAIWGLGHTVTVMIVGGSIVLLNATITPGLALGMELSVALMLIFLGLLNLWGARQSELPAISGRRPLLVGMVHGMAGSASIALLVLTTIRAPSEGMVYLFCFGVGTMAGMIAVTSMLAVPCSLILAGNAVSRRWLVATSGLVSVAFGVMLACTLLGPAATAASASAFIAR